MNDLQVVIFQKNIASDQSVFAWKIINNLVVDNNYPFDFPTDIHALVSDDEGNSAPQTLVTPGQMFQMANTTSGDQLVYKGPATNPKQVQIANDLKMGMSVLIFKGGKVLNVEPGIPRGQSAVFEFNPTIWIGVASEMEEGQLINPVVLENINTELSLQGVSSADILMLGGGPEPFMFLLENVHYT